VIFSIPKPIQDMHRPLHWVSLVEKMIDMINCVRGTGCNQAQYDIMFEPDDCRLDRQIYFISCHKGLTIAFSEDKLLNNSFYLKTGA
jgi:hypothetical protein